MKFRDKTVVVVGGGIAGLSVALELVKDPDLEVVVLEAAPHLGGRLKTTYEKDRVVLERGPWRVHADHAWMRRLITKHLGLKLLRNSSSSEGAVGSKPSTPIARLGSDFSVWDGDALSYGSAVAADRLSYATGYGPELRQEAIGGNTYRTRSAAKAFYYIKEGFSAVIQGLQRKAMDHPRVKIHLNHRVCDIVRADSDGEISYRVEVRERLSGTEFHDLVFHAGRVCIAAPPHSCRPWPTLRPALDLAWSALASVPLMHIYASIPPEELYLLRPELRGRGFHLRHEGISSQLISGERERHDPHVIQVAYAGGARAMLLERLRQSDPQRLCAVLASDMVRALARDSVMGRIFDRLQGRGDDSGRLAKLLWDLHQRRELHCHYFPHAVHKWEPSYGTDLRRTLRLASLCIDPVALPGVVAAGEAFSLRQGWCEGALHSAAAAAQELRQDRPLLDRLSAMRPLPNLYMRYGSWILDVAAWARVHPGGEQAIKKYATKKDDGGPPPDVTELFEHIGHSSQALRTLAGLRVGLYEPSRHDAVYLCLE